MAARHAGVLHVGTSGYEYDHWKGRFYPGDLPQGEHFAYYARHFGTVEINNTFYRLPDGPIFSQWARQAPEGFLYALKFSRYGSHMKRLKAPRSTIGKFVPRARRLGAHLGPILVQLPPRWRPDPGRLDRFLDAAPGDLRWAVEVRDRRWLCDRVYRVLERHGAALCVHDMIEDHPRVRTAGWVYLRYHGRRYGGGYTPQKLTAEARRIGRDLHAGADVYVYFNNDLGGHAVTDAASLRRYVGHRRGGGKQ